MSELISIIVPCYNQAQYLDECLQSVLDQNYENWECIIINDGSPDHTETIALGWTKKDPRFKYIYQKNKGVSSARNLGIQNALGNWILPLDGDDRISENYLYIASKDFFNGYKVIYSDIQKFGTTDAKWNLKPFSLENLAKNNIIHCSAFFKKTDWEEIGGFDENMVYGIEDWEFWIAMLKNGGKVKHLNEYLFFYRFKETSRDTEISNNSGNYLKMINYIEKKHYDFFSSQLGSIRENYIAKEKLLERYNTPFYKIYSKFRKIASVFKIKVILF